MSVFSQAVDAAKVAVAMASNAEAAGGRRSKPEKYEGYLLKKKKWPMKGWHRRYFFLDDGFLKYAKSPHGITKNKLHGMMDMGMSVMSTKKNALTIDLDTEDTIFHLKLKSSILFQHWVSKLRLHRDYRLYELKKDSTLTQSGGQGDSLHSPIIAVSDDDRIPSMKSNDQLQEACNHDLTQSQLDIAVLGNLVSDLQAVTTAMMMEMVAMPPPPSPSLSKKERKSKKVSKKKHSSSSVSVESGSQLSIEIPSLSIRDDVASTSYLLASNSIKPPASPLEQSQSLSRSNPDVSAVVAPIARPLNSEENWNNTSSVSVQSTPVRRNVTRHSTFSDTHSNRNSLHTRWSEMTEKQNKFLSTASRVHKTLSAIFESLKQFEEKQQKQPRINALKNSLYQLSSENQELRARLSRIHAESLLTELGGNAPGLKLKASSKPMLGQLSSESQLSITETASEMFYDAEEYMLSDEGSSSDEGSEMGEDEASSGLSDGTSSTSTQSLLYEAEDVTSVDSTSDRRRNLPCHKPDTDISLWNILKKNIGKDLSKVAMPVTLNEPLNALQLLCEEVEYCNLLEQASNCLDPHERMVYVAAFAITAYGSTQTRAGQKPFNPILGETYECIRDDKRFRFVAEQVSHHPPISACHCDGDTFEYWQDLRFKNKFWGKSLEVFPIGSVHVRLKKHESEYKWRKVTSCVHNIMSGTRWIEHYGDMSITCGDDTCKVSFSKSGYWSSKNGEINGAVIDGDGVVRHKLHGKWFEGIYADIGGKNQCIWRPHRMPADYEKQYGFSQFAIELNELDVGSSELLPRTDSRFRPDQRCLENGDIPGAEQEKARVEQLQRDQKKRREQLNVKYEPLFFKRISSDEDCWIFKGDYWRLRQDPGFKNLNRIPKIW
ncbi:oxysterol-binding protein-related protein 6-like isoform X1 [Clavelina lepadiformis]|uniref:oxysterol-binding protein-related protein 6-like isoform X1 n=1 Tax=Clavelina lepadiformis TaxID=159417 RepID=UPI0040411EBE